MSTTRSHATRLLHLTLLLIVLHQLVSSTVMERPMPGDEPAWPFALHQMVGLIGLGVIVLFWLWTLVRNSAETPVTKLLPWASLTRIKAVFADVARVLRALLSFRAPPRDLDALASAVHGLGLLVASTLALSGAAWFFFFAGTPYGRMAMGVHKLSANLMWAYLIGHALVAVLHHALGDDIFSRMFWVKRRSRQATVAAE